LSESLEKGGEKKRKRKKKEERTSFRSDCACQRDGGHREGLNHEETDGIWDGCRLVTNEGRERDGERDLHFL